MKGRTTFVIAHRLATMRNATRILVLQNGRIIETGTFDELMRRGGFFAELVQAQFMIAARQLWRAKHHSLATDCLARPGVTTIAAARECSRNWRPRRRPC